MEQDGHRRVQKDTFQITKCIIMDKPAWGGCSWDNQTLFDSNGYPLQSLKFYKDSVSKGKEQIIALKIVDKNGKEVYAYPVCQS